MFKTLIGAVGSVQIVEYRDQLAKFTYDICLYLLLFNTENFIVIGL